MSTSNITGVFAWSIIEKQDVIFSLHTYEVTDFSNQFFFVQLHTRKRKRDVCADVMSLRGMPVIINIFDVALKNITDISLQTTNPPNKTVSDLIDRGARLQ